MKQELPRESSSSSSAQLGEPMHKEEKSAVEQVKSHFLLHARVSIPTSGGLIAPNHWAGFPVGVTTLPNQ